MALFAANDRMPEPSLRQAAEAVVRAHAGDGARREVDEAIRRLERALATPPARPSQLHDDFLHMTITLPDGSQDHQVFRRVEPLALNELGVPRPMPAARQPLTQAQRAHVLCTCLTVEETIALVEEMHGIRAPEAATSA